MLHLEDTNFALSHYFASFMLGPLFGGAFAGIFSLYHRRHFSPAFTKHNKDDDEGLAPAATEAH